MLKAFVGIVARAGLLALVCFGPSVVPGAAAAQEPVVLSADTRSVSLAGRMSVLKDDSGALSIKDVAALPEGAFRRLPGYLAGGYSGAAFWLRIVLERQPGAEEDWVLDVGMPYLDHVDLHVPAAGGGFDVLRLGDRLPAAERPIAHARFAFPVRLPEPGAHTLFLRVRTTSTAVAKPVLHAPVAFAETAAAYNLAQGVLHGATVLILLLSFFHYVGTRDPLYRGYAVYCLCAEAMNLNVTGYVSQYLFPEAPALADRLVGGAVVATVASGTLFAARFLDFGRRLPRLNRLHQAMAAGTLACGITVPLDLYHLVAGPLQAAIFAMTLVQMAAAGWLAWQGFRSARVFIMAFAVTLAAAALLSARNLGVLLPDVVVDWGGQVSLLLHMVFLNVGISQRINEANRERDAAQRRLLEESRRVERELEGRVAERTLALERALREQRNFLGVVSHEFRVPLGVILAAADTLSVAPAERTDLRAEETDKIRRTVRHMTGLIERCLSDEGLDNRTMIADRVPVRLADVARGVVDDGLPAGAAARVRLTVRTDAEVEGDRTLLATLVANLVANALKYGPEDGPVEVAVEDSPRGVAVTVADRGPGVPEDLRERVFERFFRATRGRGPMGLGLGLHIVRQIVELHGGTIRVADRPGGGAAFTVELPARPVEHPPAAEPAAAPTPGYA